jgi:hypothetical protein
VRLDHLLSRVEPASNDVDASVRTSYLIQSERAGEHRVCSSGG